MGRSPGFGSTADDSTPYSDSLSLRLPLNGLTLPPTVTPRLILQKARSHPAGGRSHRLSRLELLVGPRFQVLFHSPPGVLFTVPSRYCALSVTSEYLALQGGPCGFPRGFTGPVVLGDSAGRLAPFAYGALTLFGWPFQAASTRRELSYSLGAPQHSLARPTTPMQQRLRAWHYTGLGSSPFARRYLGNRGFFLFLRLLRCFTSPGSLPWAMYSPMDDRALPLPGFPIRTSWDQSLLDSSPRLIAVCHVLHRLLVPRHPPWALPSLAV
jgi:hypothetical protein